MTPERPVVDLYPTFQKTSLVTLRCSSITPPISRETGMIEVAVRISQTVFATLFLLVRQETGSYTGEGKEREVTNYASAYSLGMAIGQLIGMNPGPRGKTAKWPGPY